MKKKVVRLGKLNRLYVHTRKPDQGIGPCALELSAVLNCWSNSSDGNPDAAECRAFVDSLTNCMRTYVGFLWRFYCGLLIGRENHRLRGRQSIFTCLNCSPFNANTSGRLGTIR